MNAINIALILASGRGVRAGGNIPKQYQIIGNKSILWHTINNFNKINKIDKIIIVIHPDDENIYKKVIINLDRQKILPFCFGGLKRQHSVVNGLRSISYLKPKNVLIHDAVRPFFTVDLIDNLIFSCNKYLGSIAAFPITDTVKLIKNNNFIDKTIDRNLVWQAQTPQVFDFNTIIKVYNDIIKIDKNKLFNDDAEIFEYFNLKIKIVKSIKHNIKITYPEDFIYANMKLLKYNV